MTAAVLISIKTLRKKRTEISKSVQWSEVQKLITEFLPTKSWFHRTNCELRVWEKKIAWMKVRKIKQNSCFKWRFCSLRVYESLLTNILCNSLRSSFSWIVFTWLRIYHLFLEKPIYFSHAAGSKMVIVVELKKYVII